VGRAAGRGQTCCWRRRQSRWNSEKNSKLFEVEEAEELKPVGARRKKTREGIDGVVTAGSALLLPRAEQSRAAAGGTAGKQWRRRRRRRKKKRREEKKRERRRR
jgi:hypothetical protein